MKVVSIVGARPQFIKAAAVSRKLRERHVEVLVHTGQHYDYEMPGIFFDGLDLPAPDANLGVGSGPHGFQTAAMLCGLETLLLADRRPAGTLQRLDLRRTQYLLATVHRSENTDDRARFTNILSAFNRIDELIVFPVHPRARRVIVETGIELKAHVRLLDPVGYLD